MPSPTIANRIRSRGMSTTKPLNPLLRPPVADLLHSRLASDIALRGEESIEDFTRHGRGGACAAASVLDDDAERDARLFGWREREEQPVVALRLLDVLLAILLVLPDRDDLRGAGFARDVELEAFHLRERGTAGFGRHADHCVTDELPMLRGVVLDARQLVRLEQGHLAGHGVLRAEQETRREARTSRRERRASARELNRRHEHVALADAGDHGLAGEPDLVLAAREVPLLPLARRHDATLLARDVEPRRGAETERRETARQVVDAHSDRELIEVDVARAHDCLMQADVAVDAAASLAVAVRLARKPPLAGTVDLVLRRHGLVLQRGQGDERLDRRARRIGARERAIEQRLVGIRVQRN